MTTRKLLTIYTVIGLAISLPFIIIHLLAKPDDAPITPIQHVVAAGANFFGPWGGAVVRTVDFPNAGLRSFSWVTAIGLTLVGAVLLALPRWTDQRPAQIVLMASWTVFSLVWFTVGLGQIADGLL